MMEISLEKQYAERLGRLAQLCDTVIPALIGELHESQILNLPSEITDGIAEIMDYVEMVRPQESITPCHCYPEHCTDTSHGECWCSPQHDGDLIIHQRAS